MQAGLITQCLTFRDIFVGTPTSFQGKWVVIVYRSGLTKGTGVLSGARRIDVTMSITRIPL